MIFPVRNQMIEFSSCPDFDVRSDRTGDRFPVKSIGPTGPTGFANSAFSHKLPTVVNGPCRWLKNN